MTDAEFTAALAEERACIRDFLDLLRREQAALVGGEHDRLLSFTERKAAHLLALRRYADARNRHLADRGLAADRDGMMALFARQPDARMAEVWKDLMTLAAEVRDANEVNGLLVAARLRHNQASLAALQAAANAGGSLYGPDGGSRLSRSASRALATA